MLPVACVCLRTPCSTVRARAYAVRSTRRAPQRAVRTILDFAEGYPPVDNDPELFAHIAPALPELQLVDEPLLIAEDFAFYQRHLPGVFFLLGHGRARRTRKPDRR